MTYKKKSARDFWERFYSQMKELLERRKPFASSFEPLMRIERSDTKNHIVLIEGTTTRTKSKRHKDPRRGKNRKNLDP
jgi:hypothetical protein